MDPQLVNYNGQLINLNGGVLANKFPIRDGLVVYADAGIDKSYPDGGSAWNDLSPSGLDGTLTNNPTFNNVNGGSLTFDGIDDYCLFGPNAASLPTSLQGDPNFTVCGWFRIPESFANQSIWSIGTAGINDSFNTYNVANTDEIALDKYGGPTLGCGESYSKTDWKFVCWRKVAGALQTSSLTIDVNTSSFTGSDLTALRSNNLTLIPTIGNGSVGISMAAADTPTQYNAPVEVGNFMVFDRVITDAEVAFLYNHQKQRFGHIIEDGLVLNLDAASEYSYPGTGTTWSDLSPSGNDATLVNGPTYQSDPAAIVFDGVNDYATVYDDSDVFQDNDSFTATVWFSYDNSGFDTPNSNGGVMGSQRYQSESDPGGWGIHYNDAGGSPRIFIMLTDASGSGGPVSYQQLAPINTFELEKIDSYTFSYDSSTGTVKGYKNGSLESSSVNSSYAWTTNTTGRLTQIGRATQGGWSWFEPVTVAEVQVYKRTLTDDEIAYNFEARRGRYGI